MKLRFTPTARTQFLETLAYIRQDKPSAARRFRERVETVLRRLEDVPESGRVIPEFPELPHREVLIGVHRFLYRVERQTVWVVAVWHGARRMREPDSGGA